jgi:hypothetical protein
MSSRRSRATALAAAIAASLVSVPALAEPAGACAATSPTCSVGSAALRGTVREKLATNIDSGWMERGPIKLRARFTIDPVGGEPLLAVDMPDGAVVEATWQEKGFLTVRPLAGAERAGRMHVQYTLVPSLEARLFGVAIERDAASLAGMLPGGALDLDARTTATVPAWGFAGALANAPTPPLEKSTLFTLPFEALGIDGRTAEGSLSMQAAATPSFRYVTREVQLDGEAVTSADGSVKLPIADADFVDVSALVVGDLALSGELDIRPIVRVDSAFGVPTFGLTRYDFSVVKRSFGGAPTPVSFERVQIHIPLPNVKVPAAPVAFGAAARGDVVKKQVAIESTGEREAVLRVESSDPQFVVAPGEIRVPAKGRHELEVAFQPSGGGPASATITVRSNDPDAPEQTFQVAANGASLDPDGRRRPSDEAEGGCGCVVAGARPAASSGASALGALGLALGLAVLGRRRRGA